MTDSSIDSSKKNGYLFSVDVFIEGETNGIALEKLLQLLNSSELIDFRINKGINLGQVIEAAVSLSDSNKTKDKPPSKPGSTVRTPPTVAKKDSKKNIEHKQQYTAIIDQIEQYRTNNALVRLSILKGKGVTMNLPCRILNCDLDSGNITVYHVDEKKVYTFQINEIEDLQA